MAELLIGYHLQATEQENSHQLQPLFFYNMQAPQQRHWQAQSRNIRYGVQRATNHPYRIHVQAGRPLQRRPSAIDRLAMEDVQHCENRGVDEHKSAIPVQQDPEALLREYSTVKKKDGYLNSGDGGPVEHDIREGCLEMWSELTSISR